MKKLILFVFTVFLLVAVCDDSKAQQVENRLELGLRINSSDNPFSAAFDGTYNISKGNRIHADLGIGNGGIGADFIHDWLFSFDGNRRLIFYPGLGGSLYFLSDDVVIAITAEIGLEYRFDIPLSLGLDFRPSFNILPSTDLVSNGVGLNIRYRF